MGASQSPGSSVTVRRQRPTAPWSTAGLESIVIADVFGTSASPVTRAEAMKVPAIANARWLIATPLSRQPLLAYRRDAPLKTQPAWLYRTAAYSPAPQLRILWTLDDLLFSGYSLWTVERDDAGRILEAERVALQDWDFDEQWRVCVLGIPVPADQVILFTSPMDPLLDCADETIRAARNLEAAWAARVADPIPLMEIKQTEDIDLDDPQEGDDDYDPAYVGEVQDILNKYVAARRRTTSAVVFTPFGYELNELGKSTPELFVEGRNAIAIDVARFTGLPASLLSASPISASLTYSTSEAGRSDYQDYSLSTWAMAIESRLSMDDVTPAGTSIKFDLSYLTAPTTPPTGPVVED